MGSDNMNLSEEYNHILSKGASLDDALNQIIQNLDITNQTFTHEEIEAARGNLSPMNDRVAAVIFADNKNNHIITGIADNLKKIYDEPPIPPIERTFLQELTLPDVLGRGMIADMISEGWRLNIATEIQKGSQADFAVRGTLSSSNIMRRQFNMGNDYSQAPDVMGIYILGFNLPQFIHKKEFVTRIVRTDYDTGEHFLAEKYSDFYIELSKIKNYKKECLPKRYHELWDLCIILSTKIKNQEEVIKMQAVQSPLALDFAQEVKKAVAPAEFVNNTMRKEQEITELRDFLRRQIEEASQKAAQEAAQKAAQEAEQKAKQKATEEMIIAALKINAPDEVIDAMKVTAGITDLQLIELREQAQK